jgi:hypothetical protein
MLNLEYPFWQEGSHAEMLFSEAVMREKLDCIHRNPVKSGCVDMPGATLRADTIACFKPRVLSGRQPVRL